MGWGVKLAGALAVACAIAGLVCGFYFGLPGIKPKNDKKQPNILFIMSDDHANRAISAYTDVLINTPNIDRIAKEGIRFNRAFTTNSLCGPARAVVLTSKYSHINGFLANDEDKPYPFDETQYTFPKLLKKEGYYTSIIGKYHLNSFPTNESFDYWQILKGQGDYYGPQFFDNDEFNPVTYEHEYVTDKIAELTIDTIKNKALVENEDGPWMVMMHNKAPHRNQMAPIRKLGCLGTDKFDLPDTYFDFNTNYETRSDVARDADMKIKDCYWTNDLKMELPEGVYTDPGTGGGTYYYNNASKSYDNLLKKLNDEQRYEWDAFYKPLSDQFYIDFDYNNETQINSDERYLDTYNRWIREYLQVIASVDESVGSVLDYLEESGQAENTLVVYTSDQGFFLGEHGFYDKRFMYEPSLKTPLLMRYPGTIAAGRVEEKMTLNLDYGVTFLDLAGIEIPEDTQGESLKKILEDKQHEDDWRKSIYYHYYEYPGWHGVRKHYGVRTETAKLIHFYDEEDGFTAWEMYDLENDYDELNNIYGRAEYAELQSELEEELERLRVKYKDDDIVP